MCRVRQIKLVLVDKGPFTHRCMVGELGVQSATLSKSQPANQPVSKLISQPATQTPKAAAAACVAFGSAQDDLTTFFLLVMKRFQHWVVFSYNIALESHSGLHMKN